MKQGTLTAEINGCTVKLTAEPVPPRIWTAMVRAARGNFPLEEAIAGRRQSVHLEHLMTVDWSEPLVPRAFELGRVCSCDESTMCEHIAAVAYAVRSRSTRTHRFCCAGAAAFLKRSSRSRRPTKTRRIR